jgi:hypothetical protein
MSTLRDVSPGPTQDLSAMSKLHQAEDRALRALSRLERACQARADEVGSGGGDAQERERLLREAEALRAEIEGLRAREARLLAVVGEVEGRVEGAIGQIDRIARG